MEKIKILIAEDHQMFRKGLVALLNNREDMEIVGEAADGVEIISLAEQVEADIVLMDVYLPQSNGLEATRTILQRNPELKVLGLSGVNEEKEVLGLLEAGAKGYVLKNTTIEELVLAIKALAGGNSYFSSEVSITLFSKLKNAGQEGPQLNRPKNLTLRETEILRYISEELTNKEIADRLFISPRTVETHRRNLVQKLKVKNTVGLVKYYWEMTQKPAARQQ